MAVSQQTEDVVGIVLELPAEGRGEVQADGDGGVWSRSQNLSGGVVLERVRGPMSGGQGGCAGLGKGPGQEKVLLSTPWVSTEREKGVKGWGGNNK